MAGIVEYGIDTIARYYQYASQKFRTKAKAPPYVGLEVGETFGIPGDVFSKMTDDQKARIAATIPWIYSNITRVANEVSAAGFSVFKKGTNEKDIDHPLETIFEQPNEFFDGMSLLKYTIWGLNLDHWGAFWFLVPDKRTGKLREIWPVPIGRLKPIKHERDFIKQYLYTPKSGKKPMVIDGRLVCRFFFSHPWDMWKSITPLEASTLAMSVYDGITKSTRDLFTKGRGIPLAVLGLDPNINEPDFEKQRARLKEDWAEQRRIAVVRSGDLNVATVGLSNRELETVKEKKFNRDEIDAIFMNGIEWRSGKYSGDQGSEAADRQIKANVIWPIHRLLAAQINLSIVWPFFGREFLAKFDDVRSQDRSILLQERNVYWRAKTVNEARSEVGEAPFEHELLPGYGELPLSLATNAAFVTSLYGLAPASGGGETDDVGNLEDQRDPTAVTNQLANDGNAEPADVNLKSAVTEGIKEELKRYRKVLLRTWRKSELAKSLVDRNFDTDIIFSEIMVSIKEQLETVQTEEDIKNIFAPWID